MNKMGLSFFFVFLISLFNGGCRNKMSLDANGVPHTLLVGIYQGDNPADVSKVLEPIRRYLEKKLAMKVEFRRSTDYTSVVEALFTKKVHIAQLSPFSYVLATQKEKLMPLVVMAENGKPSLYRSVIVTNPGTGLKTMEDVKARAKTLTLCFADPASTSGHLVPRAYLTTIGLDPGTAFKQVMFAGNHAASALTVKAGKVDIGCAFEYALSMLTSKGILGKNDLVILWTSDPIVESPIVARTDINEGFIEKVRDAYLRMPIEAPSAFKAYVSLYRADTEGMSYVPAADSMYEGIRKISAGIRDIDHFKK